MAFRGGGGNSTRWRRTDGGQTRTSAPRLRSRYTNRVDVVDYVVRFVPTWQSLNNRGAISIGQLRFAHVKNSNHPSVRNVYEPVMLLGSIAFRLGYRFGLPPTVGRSFSTRPSSRTIGHFNRHKTQCLCPIVIAIRDYSIDLQTICSRVSRKHYLLACLLFCLFFLIYHRLHFIATERLLIVFTRVRTQILNR